MCQEALGVAAGEAAAPTCEKEMMHSSAEAG